MCSFNWDRVQGPVWKKRKKLRSKSGCFVAADQNAAMTGVRFKLLNGDQCASPCRFMSSSENHHFTSGDTEGGDLEGGGGIAANDWSVKLSGER
jgi:hypothetical protein